MKKAITYTSAPHEQYQKYEADTDTHVWIWVGGGKKQMFYIDTILGFSATEDGPDGMKRTIIHLSSGHDRVGVGTVDEFGQKVADA